jgi:PAS domain S-box-containing protein
MPDPKPSLETNAASSTEHKLALLQAVFDEIPDVIVLKDARGDFLLCNQTLARLYGTTPEAMVGKHDDDFGVPKEVADGFRDNVLGIMARGQTEVVFEDSLDAVTNEWRHYKSIKRPFKDSHGNNQILVIAQDITDVVKAQQKVAASERRLRDVMAATQEGIWDWHVATGQVSHNDQWYRLLGFSEGEIADNVEAFSAHVHPQDRQMVWERIQRLLSGMDSNYHSEHRMVQKDGTVIWVQDRGRVAERGAKGQAMRVVGAYANITERRQHQVELELALSTAQEATRAKSNFLATMSHELRTPLNGILGMAQMLQMPQVEEEARRDYARTIVTSGQSLLRLLNDILDLSKVEAGRLELDQSVFDLKQLVADTTLAFEDLARSKGLTLETRFCHLRSIHYLGDPLRLRQMVSNYLGNAIKFTPHGTVVLEVGEVSSDGKTSQLEFSVSDSGIGIAVEKQALLFKPFIQADSSTTREFGGTGLGLSIVARLAELMNGQVGLESSVGIGSRFWFRVATEPQANLQKPVGTPVKPVGSAALAGRILVAEDNPVNRLVAKALLESQGLHADYVEDGKAAVDAVTGGAIYDLILMDIQMPVMDGQQATRCIRDWETQNGAKRSAIVALSAGAFDDDKQRCAEAGMDDFLAKPIELPSLISLLSRWLAS